jgi:hypothetical protein
MGIVCSDSEALANGLDQTGDKMVRNRVGGDSVRLALQIVGSIISGFLLMIPLGMLFDAMNWPLFHSWGLAHGSFLLAWPALTAVSFIAILAVRMAMKRGN